jgi:arylsulfatase
VLLAVGNRFGGYVFYMQDGRLTFEYNTGHGAYTIKSEERVAPGDHRLRFEFAKTGELRGRGTLLVDGLVAGSVDLERTWTINPARGGLYCGRDGGSPVSPAYACPFAFTGVLRTVVVELGDDQERDRAAEHRAALAED